MKHLLLIFLFALSAMSCASGQVSTASQESVLRVGAEVLFSRDCPAATYSLLTGGNRIAVVANQTSVLDGTHLVDTLVAQEFPVVKIFCPEHGFRGTEAAGAKVDNSTDPKTGLPIISLYGKNKKPTPEQMKGVDVVIFDLQDVGCRFYTYISTLHYVMEACAESNVPLIVLDRPNPNGHYVDGPVLDTSRHRSFVGMHPVPIVYGMTIGEYARMINGEHWLAGGVECRLAVVPMQGYKRDSVGYELPVPPSPNLRNAHAIALYPSLCLFEGTTVSVGRGTEWPFEVIGTPFPVYVEWHIIWHFDSVRTAGPISFKPEGSDRPCYGIDLRELDVPAKFDLSYLYYMYNYSLHRNFFLGNGFFDKLAGNGHLRRQIEAGMSEEDIRAGWQPDIDHFLEIREKYLIYQ